MEQSVSRSLQRALLGPEERARFDQFSVEVVWYETRAEWKVARSVLEGAIEVSRFRLVAIGEGGSWHVHGWQDGSRTGRWQPKLLELRIANIEGGDDDDAGEASGGAAQQALEQCVARLVHGLDLPAAVARLRAPDAQSTILMLCLNALKYDEYGMIEKVFPAAFGDEQTMQTQLRSKGYGRLVASATDPSAPLHRLYVAMRACQAFELGDMTRQHPECSLI